MPHLSLLLVATLTDGVRHATLEHGRGPWLPGHRPGPSKLLSAWSRRQKGAEETCLRIQPSTISLRC